MSEITFSANDAVAAQRELRRRLGLSDEQFPLPAFIGMLSDEIEKMRTAGHSDAEVAATITHATGKPLSPDDIATFYARPEARARN
jgi:hypothetical protein